MGFEGSKLKIIGIGGDKTETRSGKKEQKMSNMDITGTVKMALLGPVWS